jgi:hypothetical protein
MQLLYYVLSAIKFLQKYNFNHYNRCIQKTLYIAATEPIKNNIKHETIMSLHLQNAMNKLMIAS